jgi:outer membrane lipoprotein-sorting protein
MRYIVLALTLCFMTASVEAKPRTAAHKVKAKRNKVKGRKAVKHQTVRRNTVH